MGPQKTPSFKQFNSRSSDSLVDEQKFKLLNLFSAYSAVYS